MKPVNKYCPACNMRTPHMPGGDGKGALKMFCQNHHMKDIKDKPDFTLIPFSEIEPEARDIAVSWVENYTPYGSGLPEIGQKHKLASDIMNYAKWHSQAALKRIEELEKKVKAQDNAQRTIS